MSRRWGLGPVFEYEWLTTARRPQVYALRSMFVGVLLLALAVVWAGQVAGRSALTIHDLAEIGRWFFGAIVSTQLTLVLIAAPAATAGAVCQDKGRGNLALLLLTDLSDAEIVLGKLAARLVPVLGMVACALPVLALCTLLGGVDPIALAGSFFVTLGATVLATAIAFTFSVWGTRPHEVLLATFAVLAIWMLAFPVWEFFTWLFGIPAMPDWAIAAHPFFLAFAPYARPGKVGVGHFAAFFAGSLVLTAALAALAIARLRRVILSQAGRTEGRASRRLARGEALEDNPVLWYERHRRRPTPWIRRLIGLYYALAATFTALAVYDTFRPSAPFVGWFPSYVTAFEVAMGVPLMLVGAATALVEERVRGSLDVLLTTPLSSRGLVLAKWWSVYRRIPPLLLLPAVVFAAVAWGTFRWHAAALLLVYIASVGASWTSLGLALSTWFRRVGRAVGVAVTLYTLVALGLPMMVLTLTGERGIGPGLTEMSPFYGLFYATLSIPQPDYYGMPGDTWLLGWTIAHAVAAAGLLLATLATFDRCLGRLPERQRPRPSRAEPLAAPAPIAAEVA